MRRRRFLLIRRALAALPILALFAAASVVVLAARAPRTWATHWTNPRSVAAGAGESEYGAAPAPGGGWDLLWVDDNSQTLRYTAHTVGHREAAPVSLDAGEVLQPSLLRIGSREIGVWVRNDNGRTVLMGAVLRPASQRRVYQLLASPDPMEHPYLFKGRGGAVDLLLSWQAFGNFDTFLATLQTGPLRLGAMTRLGRAQYYSFYPRAVVDGHGTIDMIHLESCCQQRLWEVVYQRFDSRGRQLGSPHVLQTLQTLRNGYVPDQWAEDIQTDRAGNVWGAFGGDTGAYLFEASPDGQLLHGPTVIDAEDGRPDSLALALGAQVGYVVWQQAATLGSYLDVRRFDLRTGDLLPMERAVYSSGSQMEPHAFATRDGATIMWQLVSRDISSTFETASYRRSGAPTLAQRLGLGYGNPWEAAALLVFGALGLATLTTTVNIFWVIGLAVLGLLTIRLLRWLPSRWWVYACLLACVLFLVFVSPGGPTLFLVTMQGAGLATVPFGLLAFGGALAFVSWAGAVPLRRVDDVYRAGAMAFLGVFFFAFIEGVVFVQQQLGTI